MYRYLGLLFFVVVTTLSVSAQTRTIDSLRLALSKGRLPTERTEILNNLGSEYMYVNIRMVPNILSESIETAISANHERGLSYAYHLQGTERWLNGYYSQAIESYQKSIRLNRTLRDSSRLATNYSYLGLVHHYKADYDSALVYHHKSLDINRNLSKYNSIAHNLDNIALIHHQLGHFDKVVEYSSEALDVRSKLPGYSSRTNFYNYGGHVFNRKAFEEAISYHKRVLDLELGKGPENEAIGPSLNNIGSTYYAVQMYDSAVYYLERSAEFTERHGVPNRYAGHLNELGEALRENGQLYESESVFRKALEIWDSVGTRTSISIVNSNLARSYLAMKRSDEGLMHAGRAFRLAEEMGYNPYYSKMGYLMAELLMLKRDHHGARTYAQTALESANTIGVAAQILEGHKLLSDLCGELGDHANATRHLRIYSNLRDSIYNAETGLQLAQMQVVYETQKKGREIESLHAKNEFQATRLRQRNIITILALGVVLIVGGLLVNRYRYVQKLNLKNQLIQRQKENLEDANKEKEILLGEIHHRVKNNLQLVSSLLKLQSRRVNSKRAKDAIDDGRHRIKAMAMIHHRLYMNDQYSLIEMNDYLKSLITNIAASSGFSETDYDLQFEVDAIELDVDTAIPLGLVTNELITNCFKHAFERGFDNRLLCSLKRVGQAIQLCIQDNGSNYSNKHKAPTSTVASFGQSLIRSLVESMKGTIEYKNEPGLRVTVTVGKMAEIGSKAQKVEPETITSY